jgi:hypothetical protein
MAQAAALRAVAGAIGRGEAQAANLLRSIDWDHLAEEIEGLARAMVRTKSLAPGSQRYHRRDTTLTRPACLRPAAPPQIDWAS